jgi:peptidoglycan/LPS O-acetylase OafA/YrhL
VKVNYQNFDGIRGLAAIVVLMFHTAVKAGRPELMPVGYLAVDLFFALSGFVIAQAYGAKLHDGMGLRAFLAIRGRRLYPMFFLGQVLGFLVFAAAALVGVPGYTFGPLWIALGLGLLVLPVPVRGIGSAPPMLALNNPGWSLFFEVAINIAYALALPWLSRKVLWMLLGLGAVALLIAGVHWGDLLIGPTVKTFPGGLARVLFSFTAGVLLYEYRPRRTTFSNSISMGCAACNRGSARLWGQSLVARPCGRNCGVPTSRLSSGSISIARHAGTAVGMAWARVLRDLYSAPASAVSCYDLRAAGCFRCSGGSCHLDRYDGGDRRRRASDRSLL